ncbi:MAG: hypothetical protein ACR2O0_09695 [Rhizobiaceae bacterium]
MKVTPSLGRYDALSEGHKHVESYKSEYEIGKLMRAPFQAYWPPLALFAVDFVVLLAAVYFSIWWVAAIMAIACIIMLFDVQARMKDYNFALGHISAGRKPDRVAGILRMSWCCRMACVAAADTFDGKSGTKVREYYRDQGYRWYHIFPDGTFTLETPFRYLSFWKVTLLGYAQARGKPMPEIVVSSDRIAKSATAQTKFLPRPNFEGLRKAA